MLSTTVYTLILIKKQMVEQKSMTAEGSAAKRAIQISVFSVNNFMLTLPR